MVQERIVLPCPGRTWKEVTVSLFTAYSQALGYR
jgi:hypothetical protein